MNQFEFDQLLQKYLSGTCNEEEKILIMSWYQNQGYELNEIPESELNQIRNNIWSKLTINRVEDRSLYIWAKRGIAASVAILVLCFSYVYTTRKAELSYTNNSDGVEMTNNSSETKQIILEDGSVIDLASKSSISYKESFGKVSREVFLKGEAFFNVKKNPEKPFIVHAGELVTQVLGTSFRIKPNSNNGNIEVSVNTGRVSIYENKEFEKNKKNGIVLTPNQKIIFNTNTKEITPSIVDQPQILKGLNSKIEFVFENETIEKVVKKLSESFGIEIIIVNEEINRCVFTGDISDISLITQIEIICKALGVNYEQRGAEIFIYGKGCNK